MTKILLKKIIWKLKKIIYLDVFLFFYKRVGNALFKEDIEKSLLFNILSQRGYGNYKNYSESGEDFFINEILAKTDPKLCLDIGANIGDYSLELLKKTNSKIIAFEPLPIIFNSLKENLNDFTSRIQLENKGVGVRYEHLKINYNPNATAHASFSQDIDEINYLNNKTNLMVPVINLDGYFEENLISEVDLVKIDVEGFESEVFQGARNVFTQIRPRFIQIEFNWHQLFRNVNLYYFSKQLPGYETYQLIPDGWIKRDPKDPLSNLFMFSNFVFVRIDTKK